MRIRVLVDANILFSATAFDGLERELVVNAKRYGAQLVVSEGILAETNRALARKGLAGLSPTDLTRASFEVCLEPVYAA